MKLLQAVNQGNVERVKELLAIQQTDVNVTDNHNFSGNFIKTSMILFFTF